MGSRIQNLLLSLLFILVLFSLPGRPDAWAQSESRLDVTTADTSDFPTIRIKLIATDGESRRLPNLDGLVLSEDGEPVPDYAVDDTPVGTELIFVIDANKSINDRDEAGGLTRFEKVRDSIIRYASQFMDESQLDQVSIIVPSDDGGVLLLDRAVFPNAVINEINFYQPEPTDPTPINEMLTLALNHASESHGEGRFQTIMLFSDGAQLDQQLDYMALIDKAQAINIPIFSAILGARADDNEIENVRGLVQPTRGSYVHMPEPAEADPIYSLVQTHRPQFQVQYRSQLGSSGPHQVKLELAGATAETEVELELAPPDAELVVDNSRPIRRVVASPDDPLTSAEPAIQPLVIHVTWPDGHPRGLGDVILMVDGTPQPPVTEPILSADGLVILDWDISNLDEGTYELFVKVTDELGLQGQSGVLPMAIVVEGRAEPVPEGSETIPTPEPEEASPEQESGLLQNLGLVGVGFGLLALFGAFVLLVLAVVLVRRRKPSEAPAAPSAEPPPAVDHQATQVIMPAFAVQRANAFFEPLENAPDHRGNIEISSDKMAVGRDPNLAQIVFADKSVSRLHARIMEQNGVYQLYDEGSASGTYINFQQVSLKPQTLSDNDDVHFGRVHLRFHVPLAVDDADSTQVMPSPLRPAGSEPIDGVEEDLSTQPYMPNQPQSAGRRPPPPQQPGSQPPPDDDDADDISTQPYMPHTPKR